MTITLTRLERFTLYYILHVVEEHTVKDEKDPDYYIDDGCVLLKFDVQEKKALKRILTKLEGA